jgi:hypothetical protein
MMLRGGIVGEEVQHLGNVHRCMAAERHDAGEPDRVLARPIEHRRRQRAGLRHQRERAGLGQRAGRAGIERQRRALKAERVRTEEVNAVAARDLSQLRSLLGSDAVGDDERGAAADAADDLQCRGDLLRGQRDDREIGARLRQIPQRAAGADVQKLQRSVKPVCAKRFAYGPRLRSLADRVIGLAREDND